MVNAGAVLDVAALTRRMKAGDEAAYRTFYDLYYDRLWRYLLVVASGDEEGAGEALQATLLRVVRHIKVWPDDATLWGWLTVLARNSFSDQTRKRRRYLAFLDRFAWHTRADPGPGPGAVEGELLRLLQANLAALPAEEREVVELKYFEHCPVREIAAALQTSEKAIESRLVRIRRKLKSAVLEGLKHE